MLILDEQAIGIARWGVGEASRRCASVYALLPLVFCGHCRRQERYLLYLVEALPGLAERKISNGLGQRNEVFRWIWKSWEGRLGCLEKLSSRE